MNAKRIPYLSFLVLGFIIVFAIVGVVFYYRRDNRAARKEQMSSLPNTHTETNSKTEREQSLDGGTGQDALKNEPLNKEVGKKSTTNYDPIDLCSLYKSNFIVALSRHSDQISQTTLFDNIKKRCKVSEDIFEYILSIFQSEQEVFVKSEYPPPIDTLLGIRENLKTIRPEWKEERNVDSTELCGKYGNQYLQLFNAFHANPSDLESGRQANRYFPNAQIFCSPSFHESIADNTSLAHYLSRKIISLMKGDKAEMLKYVEILRALRPTSRFAFQGCTTAEAIGKKYEEYNTDGRDMLSTSLDVHEAYQVLKHQPDILSNPENISDLNLQLLRLLAGAMNQEAPKNDRLMDYQDFASLQLFHLGSKCDTMKVLCVIEDLKSLAFDLQISLFPTADHMKNPVCLYLPAEQVLERYRKLFLSNNDKNFAKNNVAPRKVQNRSGTCYEIAFYQCLATFYHTFLHFFETSQHLQTQHTLSILKEPNEPNKEEFDIQKITGTDRARRESSDVLIELFGVLFSEDYAWYSVMGVLNVSDARISFNHHGNDSDCFSPSTTEIQFPLGPVLAVINHDNDIPVPKELATPNPFTNGKLKHMELYAVAFNNRGHYVSLVKRGDQWYLCDDATISPVPHFFIPSGYNAAVSFYHQKQQ